LNLCFVHFISFSNIIGDYNPIIAISESFGVEFILISAVLSDQYITLYRPTILLSNSHNPLPQTALYFFHVLPNEYYYVPNARTEHAQLALFEQLYSSPITGNEGDHRLRTVSSPFNPLLSSSQSQSLSLLRGGKGETKALPDKGICPEFGWMLPDDPEFDEDGKVINTLEFTPVVSSLEKQQNEIQLSNRDKSDQSLNESDEIRLTRKSLPQDVMQEGLAESSSIPQQKPIPIEQTLDLTSGGLCFTLIDSFLSQNIPVVKASFQNVQLIFTNWSHNMNFLVSTNVIADYFNHQREVWEPVIEPWQVLFKVYYIYIAIYSI
jgi:hypothetical protein